MPNPDRPRSLGELFQASAEAHPDRPALWVDGETLSYAELGRRARALASWIRRQDAGDAALCAVFGARSSSTYVGLLATLFAGRGYVPLGPSFPAERNLAIVERSGVATILCDRRCEAALEELLARVERPLTVLLTDRHAPPSWAAGSERIEVLTGSEPAAEDPPPGPAAGESSIAYLLFTSGTTGVPKGIGIPHTNALAYLAAVGERYGLHAGDRFSQNFELTFDLSVHDLFAAWSCGGCVFVPSEREAMAPARFVRDHELTCWFSTPSTARMLMRLRLLRPGAFPSLRWSLFCGEPLPLDVAEAWQRAAPASTVENLYGPTEATIACTAYRFSSQRPPVECAHGIVPIGWPLGDTRCAVDGVSVEDGEAGELLVAGPQVAPGYWRDAEKTAERFVTRPELEPAGPWYRTGDLVSRGGGGALLYRGRTDDQIKVLGHRVELQEIEAVVREVAGTGEVAALGWPRTAEGASGIIVYLAGGDASDREILDGCNRRLPPYMVPKEIHRLAALPLNANRKVDRSRLLELRERSG